LVVFVLILGVIGFVLIDPSAVATRVKDRMLPQVSARLGRDVQVGDIHLTIIPHVGATIHNVSVAGGPGEPPLLKANEAAVSLKLWPLIRSRGHDVQVSSVELKGIDVNLVRRADGTWSYEDLGTGTKQAPAQPPGEQKEVLISEIALTDSSIHVIDKSAAKPDEASTVALSQLNVTAHDVGPGHPMTVEFSGALASDKTNLKGQLSVDPLPASAAELHAGRWPKVDGTLSVDPLSLEKLSGLLPAQVDAYINGGRLSTNLKVTTVTPHHYALVGDAKLDQLTVRGSPSSGSFRLTATVDPTQKNGLSAQLSAIKLQGPGIDLSGNASFAAPERVRFALEGQRLDLDTLLGILPPSKPKEPGQPIVPPSMRKQVAKADVSGTLALKQITSGKLQAHDLQANARLDNGVLTVSKGQVGLYSGKATLDGTRVNLLAAKPEWDLHAKLDAVDLGKAMGEIAGAAPLTGLASGTLAIKGEGNDWSQLRTNMTGDGQLAIADGALTTADLTSQIEQPLIKALQPLGLQNVAPKPPSGKTTLKDLTTRFAVKDGWLDMKTPLMVNTPFGSLSLGGKVGLDKRLDLDGKVALSQQFLASATSNKLQPKSSIDVPIQLGGMLTQPAIEGIDWGKVAQDALISQGLQGKTQDVQKNMQKQAEDKLRGLLHGF